MTWRWPRGSHGVSEAVGSSPRAPWAVWLLGVYIVALLALPTDFGLHVGGFVLTPSRIVLLAAVLLALVEWRSLGTALRGVPPVVWLAWAAFLAAALATTVIMPSAASWSRYGSLVAEGLVVFALVFWAASAPGGVRALVTTFAGTMAVVAAVVLVLAVFGLRFDKVLSDLAGTVPIQDASPRFGFERQAGPFRGALYFAIWMVSSSALLLPTIAEGVGRSRWLAAAGWLVLLISVVALTTSRLAITSMFVVPGIYFLVRKPRPLGIASLAVAAVVAVSLTTVLPTSPAVAESNEMRLTALQAALVAIRSQPLFGWGLLNDMNVLRSILGSASYVDNTYLSVALEMGLVGLTAFLLLIASLVLATRRTWDSAQGFALLIALGAVLGMGVLASVLQVSQGYAAFFVLAALAVALAARTSEAPIQVKQRL
jgi:hypothetical protein